MFSTYDLKGLGLKNRVVMASMTRGRTWIENQVALAVSASSNIGEAVQPLGYATPPATLNQQRQYGHEP